MGTDTNGEPQGQRMSDDDRGAARPGLQRSPSRSLLDAEVLSVPPRYGLSAVGVRVARPGAVGRLRRHRLPHPSSRTRPMSRDRAAALASTRRRRLRRTRDARVRRRGRRRAPSALVARRGPLPGDRTGPGHRGAPRVQRAWRRAGPTRPGDRRTRRRGVPRRRPRPVSRGPERVPEPLRRPQGLPPHGSPLARHERDRRAVEPSAAPESGWVHVPAGAPGRSLRRHRHRRRGIRDRCDLPRRALRRERMAHALGARSSTSCSS